MLDVLKVKTSRTVTLGTIYKTLGRIESSGRRTIVGFVLRQAMAQIAVGAVIGSLLAAPVAWALQGTLLDVQPFDPLVFGTVLGVLLSAGWLGCFLPALRATRVDPQIALSAE